MKTYDVDRKMMEIIKTKIIDEQDLQDYIYRQVNKKNYFKYLNEIIMNDKDTYFDQFHKRLLINFKQILEEGNQLFEDTQLTSNKDIFINTWLLLIMIHEMEHIKQRSYFYGGAKNYLEDYICREINFSTTEISKNDYEKYHDYFLYERLATFSAFSSIFDMFSKLDLEIELYDCFLQYMLGYLEIGYEKSKGTVKSPIETVFKLMKLNQNKIKKLMPKKHMSILERAQFGLPLKLEQYNKVRAKIYHP